MSVKNKMRAFLLMVSVVFATSVSLGYQVWYGLPYMPKESQTNLDQWDQLAAQVKGLNLNPVDTQRPAEDKNSTADWKSIIQTMPTAKNNCMIGVPRTHFTYDGYGGSSKPPLAEMIQIKFRQEGRYGCQIKWVMPFDNQPGEDRTLPTEEWSDAELQELRDWLDANHPGVKLLTNVRNFGVRAQAFAEKAIVDGMSIEAKAYLWYENNGRRQDYLKWAVANPLTKDKNFKFQVPFGDYDGESQYQAMRGFIRWLSNDVLKSTELVQREDTVFLVITYGPQDTHLPEMSDDETEYENTMTSLALSLIEQKAMFEGTAPGGLITKAQTLSYERLLVDPPVMPTSGLVAHWPLDEGSGTVAGDISGYGFDGELLNDASWGTDAERGTYAVFDGTDDRIATTFTYALADTNDFTWAWWAKMEPTSHSGSIMVGNRYGNTGSESLEFIKFTPQGAQFANTGSAATIEKYDYADVPSNEWHHYAMVKDGTSYQWYVDGVAQGVASNFVYSESSPLPFLIGGDGNNKPNEHFEGGIDDVVLYRSALIGEDVAGIMNGIHPNFAPTISAIANQTTLANTSVGPLAFTVGDDQTAVSALTLTALSSNTSLVPLANIVFGGAETNRTVTITPQTNQGGNAEISIIVNDGEASTTKRFLLTVWPVGASIQTVMNNSAGTMAWSCPSGVTNIQVECWGGGGAGGGATRTTTSGGAGGGGAAAGAYARVMNVPVTPGNTYNLTIPEAATCSSGFTDGQRFNGSAVTFTGDGGATVTAAGGEGGACHIGSANGAAGTGSTTGCVGEQFYKGGSGGNNGSNNGGSGGGGPSDLADGGDGSTTETGGGGLGAMGSDPDHNGGSGGNGRGAGNTGLPGNTPGGGGGGAKSQTQDGEYLGGTGGLGQIIITYVQLPAEEAPMLEHEMSGGDLVFNWTGGGFKVQFRTNLTEGIWFDVPGGDMPPVTNFPVYPEAFYRLIEE